MIFSAFRRRRSRTDRRGRLRFETLESRRVLATLGLGVTVYADDGGTPGVELTEPIQVGQIVWVEVTVEDIRIDEDAGETPAGVTALQVDLSWDSDALALLNTPTAGAIPANDPNDSVSLLVTEQFELNRNVAAVDLDEGHTSVDAGVVPTNPSLDNLAGAADTDATPIGVGADFSFGLLQFQAIAAADDTPFTLAVDESVSFADADTLRGVSALSDDVVQSRTNTDGSANQAPSEANADQLAITEFLDVVVAITPQLSTLTGAVFTDVNFNGVFDEGEFGIPGVSITITRLQDGVDVESLTVLTDADGRFTLENLTAGDYRLEQTQPEGLVDASVAPGVLDPSDQGGSAGAATSFNTIEGIQLPLGVDGVDYNFGENVIPNKRYFLASADPEQLLAEILGTTVTDTADTEQGEAEALEAVVVETAAVEATQAAAVAEPIVVDATEDALAATVEETAAVDQALLLLDEDDDEEADLV